MAFRQLLVVTSIGAAPVLLAPVAIAQTSGHISSPGFIPPAPAAPPKGNNKPPVDTTQPVAAGELAPRQAAPSAPSVEQGGELNLMCVGAGTANKTATASAWGWSSNGNFGHATVIGQRSQGFDDQVSLRIQGTEGRLRMPRTMLPVVHGGEDGWFKLNDIKIKPNEITASVGVNFMNNPKLRLDRYSGAISISGKAGDFTGRCERFEPGHTHRQF